MDILLQNLIEISSLQPPFNPYLVVENHYVLCDRLRHFVTAYSLSHGLLLKTDRCL